MKNIDLEIKSAKSLKALAAINLEIHARTGANGKTRNRWVRKFSAKKKAIRAKNVRRRN